MAFASGPRRTCQPAVPVKCSRRARILPGDLRQRAAQRLYSEYGVLAACGNPAQPGFQPSNAAVYLLRQEEEILLLPDCQTCAAHQFAGFAARQKDRTLIDRGSADNQPRDRIPGIVLNDCESAARFEHAENFQRQGRPGLHRYMVIDADCGYEISAAIGKRDLRSILL